MHKQVCKLLALWVLCVPVAWANTAAAPTASVPAPVGSTLAAPVPSPLGAVRGAETLTIQRLEQLQRDIDRRALQAKLQSVLGTPATTASAAAVPPVAPSAAAAASTPARPSQPATVIRPSAVMPRGLTLIGVWGLPEGDWGASFRDRRGVEVLAREGDVVEHLRVASIHPSRVQVFILRGKQAGRARQLMVGDRVHE